MSRVLRKTVLQVAVFVALLASSSLARAAEYATVLIDFSGSMASLSDATNNKMTIAKQRAKDFLNLPVAGRQYAVWLFYNNSTTGASFYQPVVSFVEGKTGPQAAAALDLILPDGSIPPGDNLTPLAGSMCAAMRDLIDSSTPTADRHLYTISDGLENSTPTHPDPALDCSGIDSPTLFDETLPNAGLTADSWQWKVRNMAVNGAANNASDGPPVTHLILDVDYLREWVPTAPLRAMSSSVVTLDHQASAPLVAISSSKGVTASASAPPIDPLLTFYRGMTKMTGGRFEDIGGLEVPVIHVLGDLNDNGCVNAKDLVILTRSLGKPVKGDNPADLNRDHKVDRYDVEILIKNFNKGPSCPCKD